VADIAMSGTRAGDVVNGMIGGYVVGADARREALNPVFSPDLATVERLIELFSDQDGFVVLLLDTTAAEEVAAIEILSVAGLGTHSIV
jgi:hypothetical protein